MTEGICNVFYNRVLLLLFEYSVDAVSRIANSFRAIGDFIEKTLKYQKDLMI